MSFTISIDVEEGDILMFSHNQYKVVDVLEEEIELCNPAGNSDRYTIEELERLISYSYSFEILQESNQ